MRRTSRPFLAIAVVTLLMMACSVGSDVSRIRSKLSGLTSESAADPGMPTEAVSASPTVEGAPAQETGAMALEGSDQAGPSQDVVQPADGTPDQALALDGGQDSVDLDLSLASLKSMNSYRSNLTVRWDGTSDGQPSTGSLTIRYASVREPAAVKLEMTSEGFDAGVVGEVGSTSFIQVGDTAWFFDSQTDSWMQVPGGSVGFEEGFHFTPQDFLTGTDLSRGTKDPVPQDINGITCHRYTFTEKDFTDLDPSGTELSHATGEAYVAVEGNYVVKLSMEMTMKNNAQESATFDEGTMWLDFELSDVNQPIVIEPPAEAVVQTQGRDDVPRLPDAKVVSSMETFIAYTTASSVRQAAEFYRREMPANGWTSAGDAFTTDEASVESFTKDGATASVTITAEEGQGTIVMVNVE